MWLIMAVVHCADRPVVFLLTYPNTGEVARFRSFSDATAVAKLGCSVTQTWFVIQPDDWPGLARDISDAGMLMADADMQLGIARGVR